MSDQARTLYEFGSFQLDESDQRLQRISDGKEIPVRPQAFKVLVELVENGGRLVTREKLLSTIHGNNNFKVEETLTQCIKALRKVLDDSSKEPKYIKTVPTRGYRFIATVRKVSDQESEQVSHDPISGQIEEKSNILKKDSHSRELPESHARERGAVETTGDLANANRTNYPLALASNEFSTAQSLVSDSGIKVPSESFGSWLESSVNAQKLPRASFDERSLLKIGNCTVLRTAVYPDGYEDIVMELEQTGDVKSGIAIDDRPLWQTKLGELNAVKLSGISAQVVQFLPELTDDPKARVKYRVVPYVEARAFHKILEANVTLAEHYREEALQVLSYKGTYVPNILATGIVTIIGTDARPQLVLANRQHRTGGYHGGSWAVSVGEQYMPITGRRGIRIVEADETIFRSAERGLREELLSDEYSGNLSLSVHAFVLEDYIDNFFFLAIADLRPLTFNELKGLWYKSIDSSEHNAIAALPLNKDGLLKCMQEDELPEDCWSRIREAGLMAVQPGIKIEPKMHLWQPNSHVRLAGCLWYLQDELT